MTGNGNATERRTTELLAALEETGIETASGNVTFKTPRQVRAFALVTTLYGPTDGNWAAFQREFVDQLADTDVQSMQDTVEETYYDRLVSCLVSLTMDQDVLTEEELERRTEEFKSSGRDLSEFEVSDPRSESI